MSNPVYVIDGARTPFIKVRGKPGPFSPVDLAVQCGRPLLLRQPFDPALFDQVILGCVNVLPDEMNPARIAALRMGLGEDMPAFTVQINCGSGMQSLDTAYRYIREGSADLILAGGTEALSHAPMIMRPEAVEWFAELRQGGSPAAYLKQLKGFDAGFLKPELALKSGLTDPIVGLSMGQTAEVVAQLFSIRREQADAYAVKSHQRLAAAQSEGWLDEEVVPAISAEGKCYDKDDGVRADTTPEQMASLQPVFEPPYGQVTAGNSSQVTDGACWTILASERIVEQLKLQPKAQILDSQWAALDPKIMGLAPVLSVSRMLKRQDRQLNEIDLWEINEAFAAQVLACLRAWQDDDFMQAAGLEAVSHGIDQSRLNIDGGAISLGHPVGASGNRIVLHLANAMQRKKASLGVASECIGGGQSGAMLLRAV